MLSHAGCCGVLLVELAAAAIDPHVAVLAGAAAPLQRVDSLEAALAVVRAAGPAPALAIVWVDGDRAAAAVSALAAAVPVLVLAPDADMQRFPAAACYQAGAAEVLAAALAPHALAAKVARFIALARRHVEQAGAERELRDAHGRLHSTAAATGLAMWSWDVTRDRVSADSAMRFLFNVADPAADLDTNAADAGLPVATYLRAIHPDDAARVQADIDFAFAGAGAYESDARVLAADGRYHHIVSRGEVLFGVDGKPAVLRGAVRDVTSARIAEQALNAAEARYRTLFEAVDEGVCIVEMIRDADGKAIDYRFIETNQAFVRHTGLVDAVGKTILELVPGHDPAWMTLYGEVARTGEPVRYKNDSAGAMNRWFDVYATRAGDAGSDLVAVLFTDISERKQAQLELERLAAGLAEANRRKNEFIATLAHELRNPLAPLRSGLPLLRIAGDDSQARNRVLGTMERQLDHMVDLVDDLLDVGRISHGRLALKAAPLDLLDVVKAAIDAAAPAIEARRHRLQLTIDGAAVSAIGSAGARWPLHGDSTRLVQVLSNLLDNAAKYTPAQGRLSFALRREKASDGAVAVIEVSDNGAGIAGDDLAEVFELFNQVGRQRFPTEGGLGIGLSLVRTLVELHGGAVHASSAGHGHGSTFTVRLPLLDEAAPAAGRPAPAPAASRGHAVRVLVVDDNSDAADTLAELLDLLGHSAQVAHSGAEALEAMQDFRPQVVLLDLGMPEMNGYEVAEAIRNNRRFDQPLLAALTGWGGQQDREQTRAAGFDLHLTKPVDLGVIEKILASV